MADYIISIVKRLGLFTVVAQTFLHFCPNKSYERYIKILIGTMSVTLIAVPILGIFNDTAERDIQVKIEEYSKNMESYLKEENKKMSKTGIDIEALANGRVKTELNSILKEYGLEMVSLTERENRLIVETESLNSDKTAKTFKQEEVKERMAEYFQVKSDVLEVIIDG